MFCYKSKNYALLEDGKITLRGSALRSRGVEPFLKHLTDTLIRFLLGASETSPLSSSSRITAGGSPTAASLRRRSQRGRY